MGGKMRSIICMVGAALVMATSGAMAQQAVLKDLIKRGFSIAAFDGNTGTIFLQKGSEAYLCKGASFQDAANSSSAKQLSCGPLHE